MAHAKGGRNTAQNIKLLTIGDSAVGKTCLISQFARDSFNPNFITTIGIDYKIKEVELKGKKYKLLIWDTAGQERFRTITTSYFRGCQGILLVYDITNLKSFENVESWIQQINKVNNEQHVNKLLVGNKCDMQDKRVVTEEAGRKLAAEQDPPIPFIETSAKDDINVTEAFMKITEDVVNSSGGGGSSGSASASSGGGGSGRVDFGGSNSGSGKKKGCC